MAPSRALPALKQSCTQCLRQRPIRQPTLHQTSTPRRNLTTTSSRLAENFQEATQTSHLPRIAQVSLWQSFIPKAWRRSTDPSPSPKEKSKKEWNPYTLFIFLAVFVGSNAINLIALRNEMVNFSRKADARLGVLREVVGRVKAGEEVDVGRLLGTGVEGEGEEGAFGEGLSEGAWEELVGELEGDLVVEKRGVVVRGKSEKTEELVQAGEVKVRSSLSPEQREGGGGLRVVDVVKTAVEEEKKPQGMEKRPKFIM